MRRSSRTAVTRRPTFTTATTRAHTIAELLAKTPLYTQKRFFESDVKVLGVITARGGSKGIPGKNLKPLAGKPLLAYTIEAARRSGAFDRVILSTDDEAIAAAGRDLGCDVPFIRPADLAHDETPHLPVMQHAVALAAGTRRLSRPTR